MQNVAPARAEALDPTQPRSGQQLVYLQTLRILAICLVLYNHTAYHVFIGRPADTTWLVLMLGFFACKWGVPLFVLITGATLLTRVDSYRKTALRGLRMVAVLLAATWYTLWWNAGWTLPFAVPLPEFLNVFWNCRASVTYWYFYLYLGILLMLPVLQRLAQALDRGAMRYAIAVTLGVQGLWPMLTHYWPELAGTSFFWLPLGSEFIGLLLAGAYLRRYARKTRWGMALAVAVMALAVGVPTLLTRAEWTRYTYGGDLAFDSATMLPMAAGAVSCFYLVRCLYEGRRVGAARGKLVCYVGGCAFGVFILHDGMLALCKPLFERLLASPVKALLVWLVTAGGASFALAAILKAIPGVRRLL